MNTSEYLHYVVEQIHTTILATVDDSGNPFTCAVDMMDTDGSSLFFLTGRGKFLYDRLASHNQIALSGLKGSDTMHCVSVSIRGSVRELGQEKIPELFEKNKYMYEIYPEEKSRGSLTVFQIYEGEGELFDLSKKPIERASFSFGKKSLRTSGFFVNNTCIGCKMCYSVCPQKCIDISKKPSVIMQEHCLHCGACISVCPVHAIEKKQSEP